MAKNTGGRPPKFENKEQIQKLIEQYFEDCKGEPLKVDGEIIYDKYGKPIMLEGVPPTVTGLALALGFKSRQALLNYQAKAEFQDTILTAKLKVENYAETRLFDREGVRGAEFTLSNNFPGWSIDPQVDADTETLAKLDELLRGIDDAAKR